MTLSCSLNKDLVAALLSNLQIAFSTTRGIWFCIVGTSFTYALAISTMEYALFKVFNASRDQIRFINTIFIENYQDKKFIMKKICAIIANNFRLALI